MKRMLFNATHQEELRVAIVDGQKLINFDIETTSKTQRRGNIYKGIVTRIEPSLEACFVDYGTEKQGFLPFKEIISSYLPDSSRFRDFSKLTEGTELIVQVEKDERGTKGAALTTFVSLPGRYLVLMPNNARSGGISRRIDGQERDELKAVLGQLTLPNGMSVIARTAAMGRTVEELQWDADYLSKLWLAIKTATSSNKGSFLIYQESSLIIRSIRDHFSPDISEILIDREELYEQAKKFIAFVMPDVIEHVKFYHDDIPLFSRFQIEHQIETAYSRIVALPSGGVVIFDHTEALTAIDVNSAKANKGSDIEATALATNMEAAEEIARQLRLRDLGGLIVVDFIDMENIKNQREVEVYFKEQLLLDRARIQMSKLSRFGLLELSRQRIQASLDESTTISCPRCSGVGYIRGTESSAVHILRIIQEEAVKNISYLTAMYIQLPVDVATYLLNEKRDDIAKIEARMRVKVVLIPNIHMESPLYKIKKISYDEVDANVNKHSFNLVEEPEANNINVKHDIEKKTVSEANKPAVKSINTNPAPVVTKKSFLKSLKEKVSKIFKEPIVPTKTTETQEKKRFDNNPNRKTGRYNNNFNRNNKYSNRNSKFNNRNNNRNINYTSNSYNKKLNANDLDNTAKHTVVANENIPVIDKNPPTTVIKDSINKAWQPVDIPEVNKNFIPRAFDLGTLELVSTNKVVKSNNYEENDNIHNKKRYNDIEHKETNKQSDNLKYELIETKSN